MILHVHRSVRVWFYDGTLEIRNTYPSQHERMRCNNMVFCSEIQVSKGFVVVFLGAMTMLGVWAALGTKTDYQQIRYSSSIDGTKDYLLEPLESRTGCVKRVHIFGSDREMRHIPELNKYTDLFRKSDRALSATDIDCMSEGYDCDIILTMGGDVDYLEGKDAVVFGLVPTEFRGEGSEQLRKLLKLKPGPGQTWIYFSTETPLRVLRWIGDLNFSRLKYHLLMTYDLDSDIVVPFGFFRPFAAGSNGSTSTDVKSSHLPDPLLGKEGMIAWMASNCHGQFWPRVEFIKKMRDILPLDDYGTCGRKECLPKRSEKCNKLMARYKFFFALPNSECKDYITEKFWLQSLSYGTVPVVLGSQKESYEKVAPPNSFIHISDFESDEDFVKYLHRLNEDEEAYRRFYEWRNEGEVVITFPTRPTILCRTLPYLQEHGDNMQYKYLSDSPWFNGCRRTPDRKVFDLTRDEEKALFQLENWSVWR